MNRIANLWIVAFLTACVSNTSDIPAVNSQRASGGRIFILASGSQGGRDAVRGSWQSASDLAADLESAGFDPSIVLDGSQVPSGVPVIESIDPGGACFSEPLITVLTVGVIPYLGCVQYGHRFRVRCPNGAATVDVDASFTVRSYIGWFVWPLAFSADWVYDGEGPPTRRPEELSLLTQRLRETLLSPSCSA